MSPRPHRPVIVPGLRADTEPTRLRTRMHLASCEAKALKIIDALRDNVKAMEAAKQKGDQATVKVIQDRVTELLPRVSHAKFELPKDVTGLSEAEWTP